MQSETACLSRRRTSGQDAKTRRDGDVTAAPKAGGVTRRIVPAAGSRGADISRIRKENIGKFGGPHSVRRGKAREIGRVGGQFYCTAAAV